LHLDNENFKSEEYSKSSYDSEGGVIVYDKNIKKKKILIADDNEILLGMLNNMLNNLLKKFNLNYEIITCNDGLDIINLIIKDQFVGNQIQCIITDENMEFIKGSVAVKILQDLSQRNKIKDIPVIFLTSYDDIFNVGISFDSSNYKILSKPTNYISLESVLIECKIFKNN